MFTPSVEQNYKTLIKQIKEKLNTEKYSMFIYRMTLYCHLKKKYLFIFRERKREGERQRNIDVQETLRCDRNISQMPLTCPQPGTQPITQTYYQTGNQTGNLSVCQKMPNSLSYTSQGFILSLDVR